MLNRHAKATFFVLMTGPMRLNGLIYRLFRAPRSGTVKVQLGPGQKKYLDGWINVDANPMTAKIDLWADIRYRLPFVDGTIDCFYSHHVIEHLPDNLLPFHFREMYRCLKPGGFVRVGGPNGDAAMRKYVAGEAAWFADFPDKRESVGGRLENFIFCRGEHLTILTPSYLQEIMTPIGYTQVRQCVSAAQTFHPDMIEQPLLSMEWVEESPEFQHSLIIEADKPATTRP
jgi:predicted SAM-dependent methyltransferase